MASLRSIMNPDEDVIDPLNKKDQAAAPPALKHPQHSHDSTSSSHAHAPSAQQHPYQQQQHHQQQQHQRLQQHQHQHQQQQQQQQQQPPQQQQQQLRQPSDHPTSTLQDRRRQSASSSSQRARSVASEGRSPLLSSALLPSSGPGPGPGPGQRSSVTPDAMDHHYGHGRAGSSSKSTPIRPFQGDGQQTPVKYTPVTGRVSKALKGVAVHTCNQCNPPKIFTRNEHLKRHQLSHQKPAYVCNVPGCDREFHRKDLLERHQQRHEQEGDKYQGSGGRSSRRSSNSTSDAGTSGLPQRPGPSSLGGGGGSLGQPGPVTSSESSGSTATGSRQAFQSANTAGNAESSTISPARRASTTDSYGGGPTSQGHNFNNYSYSASTRQHVPVIHSPMTPNNSNTMHTGVFDSVSSNPLILQTQFPPSEPPELMPSSASSTYSPASEWPRNRLCVSQGAPRTGSGDWIGQNGYLSPSPFTPRDMQSPIHGSMDPLVPTTTSATTGPYVYSHAYTTPLLAPSNGGMFTFSPIDASMTDGSFTEEPGVLDGHGQHGSLGPIVRSPTTPPPSIGAAHSETLATQAATLPSDRFMNSLSCMGRQKEIAMSAAAAAAVTSATVSTAALLAAPTIVPGANNSLSRAIRNAIPSYLDVYWERFHPLYPVVHRRTFEETGEQHDVLRCAMAAVATQYLPDKEARANGSKLHDHALQEAGCYHQWPLPVMQAIFLCEFFARFRGGRKTAVQPTNEFDSLYQRVLEQAVILPQLPDTEDDDTRWRSWLDLEARRRLLAACFVVEVHTGMYHEQPCMRSMELVQGDRLYVPLTDSTAALWDLEDAVSWAEAFEQSECQFGRFLSELDPTDINREVVDSFSPFDRSVVLAAEAFWLPRRQNPSAMDCANLNNPEPHPSIGRIWSLFPNSPVAHTYMALHHTPLLDLLAISGESWVFSHKVRQRSSFKAQQERLRPWANSRSACAAAVYAAGALVAFLEGERRNDDLSDYWGMYVCTLICWAFGYHAGRRSGFAAGTSEEAMEWLRGVAGAAPGDLGEVGERRKEAGRVVKLVREIFEGECVGSKNRLFVDAITILRKLEEGVNWPWF